MLIDLVFEADEALGSAAGLRSSTMEQPFGIISRVYTRSRRPCPKATWLS
jgi:hypothetical protein